MPVFSAPAQDLGRGESLRTQLNEVISWYQVQWWEAMSNIAFLSIRTRT